MDQSSKNIAKIIKIIEKKGFRAEIGCNLENSAQKCAKTSEFQGLNRLKINVWV